MMNYDAQRIYGFCMFMKTQFENAVDYVQDESIKQGIQLKIDTYNCVIHYIEKNIFRKEGDSDD